MGNRNLTMTQGHPGRLIMLFALPLMLGNVFQQLYTVVDIAIVGRGVGMEALAALGTVDWMNWMYLGLVQGLTQGFSVRMAQEYGRGDVPALKKTLGNAVRLAAVTALVTAVAAQAALYPFMRMLGVPGDLWAQAELYSRVILLGIPAMMYYNLTAAILRSVGDGKTPLLAMAVAAVTNIVLDLVAVFTLGWGIAGAAAATVVSQILAGTLCAVQIAQNPSLRFGKEHLRSDRKLQGQMMGLGLPVAGQNLIIAVGGMAVQSVVNHFDTSFIAGFTATGKLYGLLEIAAISYGYAVTTYTGQNFGAGAWQRIRQGTRWAAVISVITSVVIGALMLVFGREITMLFISSEDAAVAAAAGETAYRYLSVMAWCLPVLYLLYAYRSALQGMGNTRVPLLSGVVEFIMRVAAAAVIGHMGYQNGIFYAEVLAWTGAAVLLAAAYYRAEAHLEEK